MFNLNVLYYFRAKSFYLIPTAIKILEAMAKSFFEIDLKLKWSKLTMSLLKRFVMKQLFGSTKSKYSQIWFNDNLRITTTCLQRPQFWGSNFNFYNTKLPLNNDHLSTTATNLGPKGGRYTQVWLYSLYPYYVSPKYFSETKQILSELVTSTRLGANLIR